MKRTTVTVVTTTTNTTSSFSWFPLPISHLPESHPFLLFLLFFLFLFLFLQLLLVIHNSYSFSSTSPSLFSHFYLLLLPLFHLLLQLQLFSFERKSGSSMAMVQNTSASYPAIIPLFFFLASHNYTNALCDKLYQPVAVHSSEMLHTWPHPFSCLKEGNYCAHMINLLTGHYLHIWSRIALFKWLWRTIMSSIFHH